MLKGRFTNCGMWMEEELSSCLNAVDVVKADEIASRLKSGRPDQTHSKEQQSLNADAPTPTELRRERMSQRRLPNADHPKPLEVTLGTGRPTSEGTEGLA